MGKMCQQCGIRPAEVQRSVIPQARMYGSYEPEQPIEVLFDVLLLCTACNKKGEDNEME